MSNRGLGLCAAALPTFCPWPLWKCRADILPTAAVYQVPGTIYLCTHSLNRSPQILVWRTAKTNQPVSRSGAPNGGTWYARTVCALHTGNPVRIPARTYRLRSFQRSGLICSFQQNATKTPSTHKPCRSHRASRKLSHIRYVTQFPTAAVCPVLLTVFWFDDCLI